METGFKSGFISIIGRPNVGKSTLLNQILGEKIAIMSDKAQTTRSRIQAVYTDADSQMIFIDTPGWHKPKTRLGDFMVQSAFSTLREVDVIILLVDESGSIGPGDKLILEALSQVTTPVILAVNKVDLIEPETYKAIVQAYEAYPFIKQVVSLSALQGKNISLLLETVKTFLEEGPKYYPEDTLTDQPERVIVAEMIREKALAYLNEEIPHGVAVEIELMKARNSGNMMDIQATIICERDSHKGIIIGKNGRKLKGIGKSAREDIERLLGTPVFLQLWVKVRPGWRNDARMLKNFGYHLNE